MQRQRLNSLPAAPTKPTASVFMLAAYFGVVVALMTTTVTAFYQLASATSSIAPPLVSTNNGNSFIESALANKHLPSPQSPPRRPFYQQHRPESSSSALADIEDLTDSSIKTRLGTINASAGELTPNQPANFDQLLERIFKQTSQQQSSPAKQSHHFNPFHRAPTYTRTAAMGDVNNKTTMRFFRNNKTFASIVYTNEQSPNRRLINCHLVDLERHSPDVVLFETKYEIRTIDVEFRDMMGLIESCTEIARFRQFKVPPLPGNSAARPNAIQLFAASLPSASSSSSPARPLLVVGRPEPLVGSAMQTGATDTPPANSLATFNSVMSSALNQELDRIGAPVDDSNKLDLPVHPAAPTTAVQQQPAMRIANRRLRRVISQLAGVKAPPPVLQQPELIHHNNHSHPDRILNKELSKIHHSTRQKLVLGEITPAPAVVEAQRGGIKEALQEITSYDTTDLLAIWRGILPGTNWCGMGDRATSYNDLGFESDIDICCRAHDFCPIRLSAFSSGYGLFNWSFYTRSHCTCDQNFLDCLQRAQSPLAAVVMKFYFTVMKTTCLHDNETYVGQQQQQHVEQQQQHQQLQEQQKSQSQQSTEPGKRYSPLKLLTFPLGRSPATKVGGQSTGINQQAAGVSSSSNRRQKQQSVNQVDSSPPIPALRQSQLVLSKLETATQPVVAVGPQQVPTLLVRFGSGKQQQ